MKTVIISQARMTSTRLPGKVLKEVLNKPLLVYHIERLQRVASADELVIATTTNMTDDPIADLCSRMGIGCYRGSEEDVLSRYYEAALTYKADIVVRVTSDCPMIDTGVVDRVIGYYKENCAQYDYVCNTLQRTYPRGMDTEVFSFRALEEASRYATAKPEREHVTPYLYHHPERFRLGNVAMDRDESRYRWTVDTIEDFTLIKKIIEALYPENPEFTLQDCLELLEVHPDWAKINAGIEQKAYGQ